MSESTELLIVDLVRFDERPMFAVRCHAGTLRLGDELHLAVDPEGAEHPVRLRCVEIRWSDSIAVEMLETNFGGGVVFEGPGADQLDVDWVLRSGS